MFWSIFLVIALVITFCFAAVLLVGAPYLPTLSKQVDVALELANLNPGDTIIELGCGDGRVLIAAAKKGIKSVGYELNPILYALAWLRTCRYRQLVSVVFGNFWSKDWPSAEAIYTFLLPRFMTKLEEKVKEGNNKIKIISFAFKFPGRIVQAENNGVFLYQFLSVDKTEDNLPVDKF